MTRLEAGEPLADPLSVYAAVDRSVPGGACWVMANMVMGLDGSVAIRGRVGQLSTPSDAALFGAMRTLADVVLVGAETVRREGYHGFDLPKERVDARLRAGKTAQPELAIVTKSLDLDWSTDPFTGQDARRPVVITCDAADPHKLEEARAAAEVIIAGDRRVDPVEAIKQLADRGHQVVLCEGGPILLDQLAAANQLDELCLTISPIMGGDPLPASMLTPQGLPLELSLKHVLADDDTLFLRYERRLRERS